ncbi:MAG: hypothetical protein HQL50_03710 [Magnetococcales bacterium]|nr:hypothetical protein [Magnetococcales bacterium]
MLYKSSVIEFLDSSLTDHEKRRFARLGLKVSQQEWGRFGDDKIMDLWDWLDTRQEKMALFPKALEACKRPELIKQLQTHLSSRVSAIPKMKHPELNPPDPKKRLNRLIVEIAEQFQDNRWLLGKLEEEFLAEDSRAKASRLKSSQRALTLVQGLMTLPYKNVNSGLTNCYNGTTSTKRRRAIIAIGKRLIPQLYVRHEEDGVVPKKVEQDGVIMKLPVGRESVAEVMMAGLEQRQVLWRDGGESDRAFPHGTYGVSMQAQPESGLSLKSSVETLVENLARSFNLPVQDEPAERKKESIRLFMEEERMKGFRIYLMWWLPEVDTTKDTKPTDKQEKALDDALDVLNRLGEIFEDLTIIPMNHALRPKHLALFSRLRPVLVDSESEKRA